MRSGCIILIQAVTFFIAGCSVMKVQHALRASADDWVMYGGTIGRTNVSGTVLKPPLVPVWEYDASAGFSPYSAAIADSLLFVGNLQGEVHILQASTGKGMGSHDFGAAIVGTPVIDSSFLYVALTRDEESLLCYNFVNSSIVWKKSVGDIESSPLLAGRRLYVTTLQGKLVCLQANTGEIVWTYALPPNVRTRIIRSSPASDGNVIVFGCDDGNVYAVGAGEGKLRWTAATGASVVASPSIRNGNVYVGSLDRNLYAFDLSTGKQVWKEELGAMIYAAQAVDDRAVFIGTSGRDVYCLEAATGGIVWKATTNNVINSAPLLSGDVLYVGCIDKTLYALDRTTGKVLWKYPAQGRIKAMPVASERLLFLLVEDRTVMAFKQGEGK